MYRCVRAFRKEHRNRRKAQATGAQLFGGADCEAGYLESTWDIFASVYQEAGVTDNAPSAADGIDYSIILQLVEEGYREAYSSNKWVGRAGS